MKEGVKVSPNQKEISVKAAFFPQKGANAARPWAVSNRIDSTPDGKCVSRERIVAPTRQEEASDRFTPTLQTSVN